MPAVAAAALGALILALVVVDVFRTVLWSSAGAGPVTAAITALHRRVLVPLTRRNRTLLSMLGPLVLALVVLAWAVLLVAGSALLLQGDPEAVVHSATREPADAGERAYVAGYGVFTLGNGDFLPGSTYGQVVFVVMSGLGLLLMTLSITYLVPVIQASVSARSFASAALSLGGSAAEIVVLAWDGRRVRLDNQIQQWDQHLSTLGQQHLAYPVLHVFTGNAVDVAAPVAVTRIDDVLTLLDAVDQEVAPSRTDRRQLRASIERYTKSYGGDTDVDRDPPEPPDLGLLRAAGVPLRVDDATFGQMVDALAEHRTRTHHLADREVPGDLSPT